MTKYEEIDIGHLGDGPVLDMLQPGDIVTISGPGEHDVLVREVTRLDAFDNSAIVAGMVGPTADMVVILGREGRTLTRIQRPVPALPTVEGTYIIEVNAESRIVRQLTDGSWRNQDDCNLPAWELIAKVGAGATLTRVIPADEVKRPEVDMDAATTALQKEWMTSRRDSYELDFKYILRRVLEGEFDL